MPLCARELAGFHRRLHRWYGAHGRAHLPWRNTSDPYAIYLSEVMLQQTQVKTVLERFYEPFLARFPTIAALAKASQDDVLKAWQGLGYYSRARNLHAAAKAARSGLPQDVEGLLALPGIGRNTAHAVAAFAYRSPVPVMEANVKRVLCRIFAFTAPTDAQLWEAAHALLNTKNPFDYNQAMMDIGAMLCKKTAPDCPACPANTLCRGQKTPLAYPAKKAAKAVPVRARNILVLANARNEYFASPRKERFLGGMYHFIERNANEPVEKQAKLLGHITQNYSHFTLEASVYLLTGKHKQKEGWYSLAALQRLPMSMAEQKILQLLRSHANATS